MYRDGNSVKGLCHQGPDCQSEEHISVVKNARKLDTADSNIVTLNSILETVYEKGDQGRGGAGSQDSMDAIAEELGGLKEEILQTMNAKYGTNSVSGSSNSEAPFTVDGDEICCSTASRWMPMIRTIRTHILRRIAGLSGYRFGTYASGTKHGVIRQN